jgi:1,4-alpha-glucan branching enzyme
LAEIETCLIAPAEPDRMAVPEPAPDRREAFRAFNEGRECRLFELLGAHLTTEEGVAGVRFGVWAPNAGAVSVIGDFNRWEKGCHPLTPLGDSGVWECFVPAVAPGMRYKFFITSGSNAYSADKGDPMAFWNEEPPRTASAVWDLAYDWGDAAWMQGRAARQADGAPIAIYEVHPGSWMRVPEERNRWLTFRELALKLADYLGEMKFTHVELLPIMEHPFYASWGYQPTGFFAPTSRYGTPQDLMFLVDTLHQRGFGVIVDWAAFHFPNDSHALSYFDGSHLYAHPDHRRGYHPAWRSAVFDYARPEVRSFLLSSALFWLEKYHVDGLRVDAVSYMLYHDYGRTGGWLPNHYGGRDNLDTASFLRRLNDEAHRRYPGALTFAEEATTWAGITRETGAGGLGFDYKWDMGWMNDTLKFLRSDGRGRKRDLNRLTFRMLYAFTERFVLALSHDEVVHMKGSLWQKMWGNPWEKFASLRMLYGYLYAQPGKKLLFMGSEFGQQREWNHEQSLDWHLLRLEPHAGVQTCVRDLNRLYCALPELHEADNGWAGFEWVACDDRANGVLSFLRKGRATENLTLVVCNLSPDAQRDYRVGVPRPGLWRELFNSEAREYGGAGLGNCGGFHADARPWNGRPFSLKLTLPPLATIFFRSESL